METKFLKNTPISFLGTYPPRACGIGTFTHDLASAMADLYGEDLSGSEKIQIAALNDKPEGYAYGPEVAFEIRAQNQLDYRKAAKFLNLSQTRAVSIQHEYGIYGGEDGNYLIPFLHRIRKPVVTTLHTVVKEPTKGQLKVLQEVCQHSTRVAVLANKAISLLNEIYGVQKDKIEVIHHGTPDVPFLDTSYYKEDFQIEGRPVILTFGLLGPNKGLEIAIEAMEQVAEEFPEALYIILGATHPQLKQEQGERYRLSLENMVAEKGLEYNVAFHDRFVPLEELIKYMVSADIYLTPYLSREQISSGTLAYAIATGKAIVSTPYWYAEEMLADGRGELVPFEDPRATAETICELLRDEPKRQRMRKNAYKFGREMVWREVASSYAKTFEEVNQQAEERPSFPVNLERKTETKIPDLPEVNLQHLHTLTDDTGLFQHSTFTVPNRYHGYTTDDNARAAIAALQNWEVFKNKSILPLLKTYLSFLGYAFDRRKTCVRNFLNYDRTWQQEKPPEDSHGRFLWATGRTVSAGVDDGLSDYATRLFHQSFEVSTSFSSPRAWAFAILGGASYLE
ncbi:MAG: glycosyltransferase family 4 protein, partial [Candidatus Acetothermia bacterium]